MNPYTRFKIISNSLSVAVVSLGVGLTTYAAGPADVLAASLFGAASPTPLANAFTAGLMIVLVVLVWLSLAQFILPQMFNLAWVRKAVLGRYYFEGTWVEGVRLDGDDRAIAVVDFQPREDAFVVSGRFINAKGETTANFHADYQDLSWPVVKLKHVQNRPDTDVGTREGVAEIMFESNGERPMRFDGCFIEGANKGARLEGFRLGKDDAERIRRPDHRIAVLSEYWATLFADDVQLDAAAVERSAA